jgi:hypothetical protein
MNRIKFVFGILSLVLLISCSNSISKALAEVQNLPAPDYSYIVQPEYKSDKESVELKIKELYSAEEAKIGASGTHGYDKETKEQKDEKFWFKVVLLNSKSIEDFKNETKMNELGKEVAKTTLDELNNSDKYDKIQITFVEQWNDGTAKQLKQNIFYSLPDLSVTQLFE